MSVEEIANKLGRTRRATDARFRALHIRRAKPKIPNIWTQNQIDLLYENYQTLSRSKLAKLTGQSENNIRNKLTELGLVSKDKRKSFKVKESKRFYDWTDERKEFLKNNFSITQPKDLCEYFGCSISTLYREARALGLTHKRKQTYPEYQVEKILKEIEVKYEKEVKFKDCKYICDFVIDKVVIEVQGDYWHSNPKFYNINNLNKIQLYNFERDIDKKNVLTQLGYKVIYIWENDIENDLNKCKEYIKEALLPGYKKTP